MPLASERHRAANEPAMRARIAALLLASLVLLALLAAFVMAGRPGGSPEAWPPLAFATPEKDPFRTRFRPLVARAATEATALVALGDARERNLLRIHAAQDEMNAALDAADAWLTTHPAPAADAPAVSAYRAGASTVRAAMADALAGFLRLDFDRVAAATRTMREGESALRRALHLLDQPSPATPAGGSGTAAAGR